MSGGYFNYNQYILVDMINRLDEREERIKDYGKGIDVLTIDKSTEDLIEDARIISQLAYIFLQRVDWLLSGDDGPETFKERIKEDLLDAGFLSYGVNRTAFADRKVYGFSKKIEE